MLSGNKRVSPPSDDGGRGDSIKDTQISSQTGHGMEEIIYGSATSDKCPKAGFVRLEKMGHRVTMPTTCKSWSCLSCRDRLMAYVKMRMESGCLTDPDGLLITVTYVMATGKLRDAECATKDWAELTRLLKARSPDLKWFKIPELTKKGQVHFHAMMLGMRRAKSCCKSLAWGRCDHPRALHYFLLDCQEDCIEHELAKHWYSITEDSWIVDARPILGARGAASYLAKYFTKTFDNRAGLLRRGFIRRWSCSRNWPSPERMRLAVTVAGGWDTVNFLGAQSAIKHILQDEVKAAKTDGWAVKVGTPLAEQFEKRRTNQRQRKLGKLIYD